ncbi:MAG: DedA family protein [Betaproteobacteria bacterium]|nr:DedA family protein [Betaproteobacteria bacterium]
MSLEQLVATYGYAAILIGTFFEGETILVVGGFLAHRGYLELPWVIACAFAGTLLGDQLYFYLGRSKGMELLERRPRWQAKSVQVLELLRRHQVPLILGFRFLYGLRTITPFLIGASGVAPLRYTILNAAGSAVWALAIGIAGYVLGQALQTLLEEIKRYELWILAAIAGTGAAVWVRYWWVDRPR